MTLTPAARCLGNDSREMVGSRSPVAFSGSAESSARV